MKANILIFSIIAAVVAAGIGLAQAKPTINSKVVTMQRIVPVARVMKIRHLKRPVWNLGLRHNKHLTAVDARIITKAALLMHGRRHLEVGKITLKVTKQQRKLYRIQLINKHKKVVRMIILNSANGHIRPAAMGS